MARGLKAVSHRRDDALSRIRWDELESLLVDHYRREGFEVEHVGTGHSKTRFDGGIDLKLRKDDAYILVQSKHWNVYKVTHNAVHELLGLMVNEGATGAILVTSGEFTKAAIEASARQGHVQLVDGDGLRVMLGDLVEANEARRERFADDFIRTMSSSPMMQRLGNAAKERLVSEVERSIRGQGTVRHARKAVTGKLWLGVLQFALVLIALLVFGRMIRNGLQKIGQPRATIASPVSNEPALAREALPAPTRPAAKLMSDQLRSATSQTQRVPMPDSAYQQQTPEEIRESERRAREAMKIIEATTPEM